MPIGRELILRISIYWNSAKILVASGGLSGSELGSACKVPCSNFDVDNEILFPHSARSNEENLRIQIPSNAQMGVPTFDIYEYTTGQYGEIWLR